MPSIDWQDLLAAFALYLVLEGLLPALAPARFRQAMQALTGVEDRALRALGLVVMAAGVLLLCAVRS
ncbi:MAG: DUF2065 domain-containing protein [Pseudomonadota bacterium]